MNDQPVFLTAVPIAEGFDEPVAFVSVGNGRFWVVEKTGKIHIWTDEGLLPEPLLDLSDRVVTFFGWDQGLLSLALHPDFADNRYLYLFYTDLNGDNQITRFQVSASNPNWVDPASEFPILTIEHPSFDHHGGHLVFGPDGYLYISLGDGGSHGAYHANAQDTGQLLGKILRIDVSETADLQPYAIPPDNPFAGDDNPQTKGEIWQMGLRNPWRFGFDSLTGDLYIGDVGEHAWEEINFAAYDQASGMNFGWGCYEGAHPFDLSGCTAVYTPPIYEYPHIDSCNSVTGGVLYRGEHYPELNGRYLFGDFCTGNLYLLWRPSENNWLTTRAGNIGETIDISNFSTDEQGQIYVTGHTTGQIYRLETVPSHHQYLPFVIQGVTQNN